MSDSIEKDAGALLARIAADPEMVERVRQTVQRIYACPVTTRAVRRSLLAASKECVIPPGSGGPA